MLMSELRESLKRYAPEDLRILVAAMYKAMPKKLREEKDIDSMIEDLHAHGNHGKGAGARKEAKLPVLDELKEEIDQFVAYAYEQYYFAPNQFVHKKERPKWRFKVKGYIKDLQSIPGDSEDGALAVDLLIKLYELLSYACERYIFNTESPFGSVGIRQIDLLNSIILRKFMRGVDPGAVKAMISLVVNNGGDRETLSSELMIQLVKNLKCSDAKELAIEQCKVLIEEINRAGRKTAKKTWGTNAAYEMKEKTNRLVEMIFRLYAALFEYDAAIQYFQEHYAENDKEIALYVLLRLLFVHERKDYWVREYEGACRAGVQPRRALQNMYQYILDHGSLPKYIF